MKKSIILVLCALLLCGCGTEPIVTKIVTNTIKPVNENITPTINLTGTWEGYDGSKVDRIIVAEDGICRHTYSDRYSFLNTQTGCYEYTEEYTEEKDGEYYIKNGYFICSTDYSVTVYKITIYDENTIGLVLADNKDSNPHYCKRIK